MLKIIFYDTFEHNVLLECYCLYHRISKVSTIIDQNSYGGSGKLRKYPGHPEGPVSVSVRFSLICGVPCIQAQVFFFSSLLKQYPV